MPRPNTRGIDITFMWVHSAGVRRLTGSGAGGDVFTPPIGSDPTPMACYWAEDVELIRDQNGLEVVSTAQCWHDFTDERVGAGSRMTSPSEFGGVEREVIRSAGFDPATLPLPKMWKVYLR